MGSHRLTSRLILPQSAAPHVSVPPAGIFFNVGVHEDTVVVQSVSTTHLPADKAGELALLLARAADQARGFVVPTPATTESA